MNQLTQALKEQAAELGFVISGVALAAEPARLKMLHKWLDEGFSANMLFIDARREAYRHPSYVLEGCRSLLMLGLPYLSSELARSPMAIEHGQARTARYALGELDYHDVIHDRLKLLKTWLVGRVPGVAVRGVVDTAPLLEREFAELAGLGWVGKNTLLLNRRWGSYFFLAALLTDLDLVPDPPATHSYCGTCTACLEACPTAAFPAPYVLDANRCISYLTIEHRGPIANDLAEHLNDWVFGCDICQEVCPWNRRSALTEDSSMPSRVAQDGSSPERDVLKLLRMSEEAFREHFRNTALWRTRRRGLLRNAILIAGNQRLDDATGDLLRLLEDHEPLIRGAAAWSLIKLNPLHRRRIQQACDIESDEEVRDCLHRLLRNGE